MSSIPFTTVEDALITWVKAALPGEVVIWGEQLGPRPPDRFVCITLDDADGVGVDWIDYEPNPLVLADDVVEVVDAAANTLKLTAHAYRTGDGPVQLTTGGTLPAPLQPATNYWVIVVDVDHVKLAATHVGANHGTAIDLTDVGVGAATIKTVAASRRNGQEVKRIARGPRVATFSLQVLLADAVGDKRGLAMLSDVRAYYRLQAADMQAAGVSVLSFGRARSIGTKGGSSQFEPRSTMDVQLSLSSVVEGVCGVIEAVEVTDNVNGRTYTAGRTT